LLPSGPRQQNSESVRLNQWDARNQRPGERMNWPPDHDLRAIGGWNLVAILLLAVSGCAVHSPEPVQPIRGLAPRADRLVLLSPHFDEPVLGHGGLSCPAAPAHFFGAEGYLSADRPASLSVQVGRYRGRDSEVTRHPGPLPGAQISLVPHREGLDLTASFPEDPPYAAIADSMGLAEFSVPAGLYWVHAVLIGYRQGGVLIRLRPGASAELKVELDVQPIC